MPGVRKKGGARPGAGRKPSPPHLKQGNRVSAMLTDAEFAALEEAAGGEALGTYVRRVLVRHLARRKR